MLYGINPFLHRKSYLIKCDLSTENDDAEVNEFFNDSEGICRSIGTVSKKKVTHSIFQKVKTSCPWA